MEIPRDQADYWSGVAREKVFTHPWRESLVAPYLSSSSRILDLGCGQGRLLSEQVECGRRSVVGADSSVGMLKEARARGLSVPLVRARATELPFADGSFDVVLLFSVLTCVPHPADQAALFSGIRRVLRPGGVLVISDLLRQDDERNVTRYGEGERRFGLPSVFALPEGVVLTHPTRARVEALLGGFEVLALEPLEVVTMNGNAARAFQALARRSVF